MANAQDERLAEGWEARDQKRPRLGDPFTIPGSRLPVHQFSLRGTQDMLRQALTGVVFFSG